MSSEKDHVLIRKLGRALSSASWRCDSLHHEKRDAHSWDKPCPVQAAIQATWDQYLEWTELNTKRKVE